MVDEDDNAIRRLWAAVILQAIRDIDDKLEREGASNFIFDGSKRLLGFIWICDQLDLDAKKISALALTKSGRLKLLGRKEKRKKEMAMVNEQLEETT